MSNAGPFVTHARHDLNAVSQSSSEFHWSVLIAPRGLSLAQRALDATRGKLMPADSNLYHGRIAVPELSGVISYASISPKIARASASPAWGDLIAKGSHHTTKPPLR